MSENTASSTESKTDELQARLEDAERRIRLLTVVVVALLLVLMTRRAPA